MIILSKFLNISDMVGLKPKNVFFFQYPKQSTSGLPDLNIADMLRLRDLLNIADMMRLSNFLNIADMIETQECFFSIP